MGSGMNCKFKENFRMTEEITKLGLKPLQQLTWQGCHGSYTY